MQSITVRTQASENGPGPAAEDSATRDPATGDLATRDPATDDLADNLYALIVHIQKSCNADVFRAFGALELSLTQLKLLHHLENQPHPLALGEAGDLVHVSLPAASRLVEDLVRRGFVERYEDSEDRRVKRVRLTQDGLSVIRRINAARLDGLQQFVAGLAQEERSALRGALEKLLARPDIAGCRPEPAS